MALTAIALIVAETAFPKTKVDRDSQDRQGSAAASTEPVSQNLFPIGLS
jgi:hypothetical protein